jgi:L-ribulose-5-phosphate 4-epimerase
LAGDDAGYLSQQGALLIDPEGDLKPGVPFCPPEGDMGTGMICTNSLRPGTGNASIGTSSNVTIITDAEIGVYPEIDVITTPTGVNAALVHVNNGTSEMNVWERLFKEVVGHFAPEVKDGDLYSLMFNAAMKGDKAVKGLYSVDFFSGEPVAEVNEGKLLSIREPDAEMSLANFMRSHIYSLLAPIRLGVDILTEKEGIKLKKIVGHGGFFKTPKVGEIMLSSAFNVPALTLVSAGEGGPYDQALLAAYRLEKASGESLEDYLENKVFRHQKANEYQAEEADVRGFESFLKDYKKALEIEKHAIASFSQKKDSALSLLKEEVLRANLRLAEEGLVTLTWGNVSLIDREKGLVVIKPSGVPYEKLKAEDMVVVDLEGRVVEGRLKPSSDTPTHLALYKAFPEISSIVHTHSTYAVSWAQAAKAIPVYGTTHADAFSLPIPCTRDLRKNEIEGDYETNTGKVIAETFQGKDPLAVPGVLVAHHGPFAWGRSAKEAVDHALILEKVAEMAVLTKAIDPESSEVGENLLKKHYERKHGKNAYYGQGGNHE